MGQERSNWIYCQTNSLRHIKDREQDQILRSLVYKFDKVLTKLGWKFQKHFLDQKKFWVKQFWVPKSFKVKKKNLINFFWNLG